MTRAGRWPRGTWTRSILVGLLALMVGIGLSAYRLRATLTPLQRFYFLAYARSTAFATVTAIPPSRYRLMVELRGQNVATDADLQTRDDLVWTPSSQKFDNDVVRDQFRARIYDGMTVTAFAGDWIWPAGATAALLLGLGLLITLPKDWRRSRAIRSGERLRGRELVEPAEFNARTPADGLRIRLGRGVIHK